MQEVHLLVGVNGMWGNPGHLAHLASVISAQFEDTEAEAGGCQLEVFLAQNNRHTSTYDGIDWGGEVSFHLFFVCRWGCADENLHSF